MKICDNCGNKNYKPDAKDPKCEKCGKKLIGHSCRPMLGSVDIGIGEGNSSIKNIPQSDEITN